MKQIRLKFPICWGDDPSIYMPSQLYLKVGANQTEAYLDKEFTQTVLQTKRMISFDVKVPEELEIINVARPGGTIPVEDIRLDWIWHGTDPEWKIPGLKKVTIIMGNNKHEVPVINERPKYTEAGEGRWWFMRSWALAVYVTDSKIFGELHWHYKLARRVLFNT